MKFRILFFLLFFIVPGTSLEAQTHAESYQRAVQDASITEEGEIARNLIAITADNKSLVWNEDKTKLLVVTWKSKDAYEEFYKSQTQTIMDEAYVVWVTTVPQVQQLCQGYMRNNHKAMEEELNLRLKQYLGLNVAWQYDVFVEMWVRPEELFRPCVDPEIEDSQCNLEFSDTAPNVENIKNYPMFYKNLYFQSFRSKHDRPWTGLGYTYDWGNLLTEVGASEFILIPGAAYKIKRAENTMEYCQ